MSEPEQPSSSPPAFIPVPLRARADGWTPDRQRAFIAALTATFCVATAARAVGMSRETAYRLRGRPGAESFAAAWDAALAGAIDMAGATELWDRAMVGSPHAILHRGRQVAVVFRPADQALGTLYKRFSRWERRLDCREKTRRGHPEQ